MKNIFGTLEGDYIGEYFALDGMQEEDRQKKRVLVKKLSDIMHPAKKRVRSY